ncbi:hypothetical protein ACLF6K_00145 [Streptomyces xanthophaeus]|uniref:hypothetical protein n=1 Tax=Streptomyces xanthophaeus TaxID=67385 RepID=UPI00398F9C7A
MTWLPPADRNLAWSKPRRPLERDALPDLDATVLVHAHDEEAPPRDRDSPEWAAAIAGLINSGLLIPTEGDTAIDGLPPPHDP